MTMGTVPLAVLIGAAIGLFASGLALVPANDDTDIWDRA